MVHEIKNYIKKRIFIDTLIISVCVLLIGFSAGFLLENYRTKLVERDYKLSEIDMLDLRLQQIYYSNFLDESSCDKAIQENLIFGDKIYLEGLKIEKYEEANQISESILLDKKKYVLLKEEFWANSVLLREKCNATFHTLIYFYSQEDSYKIKAKQSAISLFLKEIKIEYGNKVILIPIARDLGLSSINLVISANNVTEFPSILIDEKVKLSGKNIFTETKNYLK